MAWYFLPESVVPVDEAMRALLGSRIPADKLIVNRPRQERGVTFEVPDQYDDALRMLGVDHLTFVVEQTDVPGIQCLTPKPRAKRTRAADAPVTRARSGGQAFIAHVLAARESEVDALEGEVERFQEERDAAQRAFFEATRRFTDAVERLAIREETARADTAVLAAEHAALIADPRVASVATTATQLIVETTPITLASDPPRRLGRYRVVIGLTDGSFLVTALDRVNGEYAHPNVSKRGIPYLGPLRDAILRRIGRDEIALAVRQLLDFLEEPPTGVMVPEMQPERWPLAEANPVT